MLKNRKKLFASLLIFLSLIIMGWFAFFEYGVKWLEKRLENAILTLKQKGYLISYSQVQLSGSPLTIIATFQNPQLKDPQGLFEWQGQELQVVMHPWSLYTLQCTFPGIQQITTSKNTYIPFEILKLEGAKGTANLTLKGQLKAATFTTDHISFFNGSQLQPVSFEAFTLHVTNIDDPLNLNLSLKGHLKNLEELLNIPPLDYPLTVNLKTYLSGIKDEKKFPQSLGEWRDRGGVLEVDEFRLSWAPIDIEAKGTLTLDQSMYPLGAFSSRVLGYQEALTYMVQLGWVKKKKAATASFVLHLFTSADGASEKHLTIPITLQDRALSIGPAPLLKLNPIKEN